MLAYPKGDVAVCETLPTHDDDSLKRCLGLPDLWRCGFCGKKAFLQNGGGDERVAEWLGFVPMGVGKDGNPALRCDLCRACCCERCAQGSLWLNGDHTVCGECFIETGEDEDLNDSGWEGGW